MTTNARPVTHPPHMSSEAPPIEPTACDRCLRRTDLIAALGPGLNWRSAFVRILVGMLSGVIIGRLRDTLGANTDGCETATTTTANCGGCGNACTLAHASAASCNGTTCSYTCNAGFADCVKVWVSPAT